MIGMDKVKAFTLAEVLITLAIIGVVAAIVIPSVVTNYRKNMYVTQLKKEYNYIQKAFKTIMARDGVTKLQDTNLFANMVYANYYAFTAKALLDSRNEIAKREFLKTFNVLEIYDNPSKIPFYKGTSLQSNGAAQYKDLKGRICTTCSGVGSQGGVCLTDGACFGIYFYNAPSTSLCGDHTCSSLKEFQEYYGAPTKLWQDVGSITVDVNGFQRGPNQWGRDMFSFVISNDGSLYPYAGIDYATRAYNNIDNYPSILTNTNFQYWKYDNNLHCGGGDNPTFQDHGCAARIMEDGWKMNY